MEEIKIKIKTLDLASELMSCLSEIDDGQFVDDIISCVTYNDEVNLNEIREVVINDLC